MWLMSLGLGRGDMLVVKESKIGSGVDGEGVVVIDQGIEIVGSLNLC